MSPRHEIEHADGSREVFESRTGERVALTVVSGSVLVAFGSLALSFFGGTGGLAAIIDAAGGAPAAAAAGVGGQYDPWLPAAWTDTVHYEDFTAVSPAVRFDSVALEEPALTAPFSYIQSWEGVCVGGMGVSGYGGDVCKAQDSVVFANQPSPPWVWEEFQDTNLRGALNYGIDFADGNGSGAAANLTRLYVRFSIFFEAAGVGVGVEDYDFNNVSMKWYNLNGISGSFFDTLNGAKGFLWGQDSLATSCDTTNGEGNYLLPSNTWVDYYPADTLVEAFSGCTGNQLGRGGMHKVGVWQHWFFCADFSPSAGNRIVSWGIYSEDESGIAGYHNTMTTYDRNSGGGVSDTDFDSWQWNGTYGGGAQNHAPQSYWFDDLLIMTGSSGSCVVPPSFS